MSIAVIDRDARRLGPLRAAIRFGCVIFAALPLLAGITIMLWDDRWRCLQDRLTRTVIVYRDSPGRTKLQTSRGLELGRGATER